MKRFEYSPLGRELRKQTSDAEKQCKRLDKAFESNKKEEDKTKNKGSHAKSNLLYSKDFTFYKYHNIKEFAKCSFDPKGNDLTEFKEILELFYTDTEEIKPNNEH